MILLIDNYDSFTFNLMHLVAGIGEPVEVRRNDEIDVDGISALSPSAVVLSPGPRTPDHAGICLDLVTHAANTGLPVFGVCLGLQSIAQSFGARIERAGKLMHGKTCDVNHHGGWLFENIPSPFHTTRYHSLVAAPASIPDCLRVDAVAGDDQEVMALSHKSLPIAGVQFHPESIASEYGEQMVRNFLNRAKEGEQKT